MVFRWLILGILLSAIATSGYLRHRARIAGGTVARRDEGTMLMATRAAVTILFLAAVTTYVIDPAWMRWSAIPAPTWVRWIGVGLGTCTIPSVYWVLTTLGTNVTPTVLTKPDNTFVTGGPYRWVRHPLYTTGLTLLLAVGLMAANGVLLVFAVLAAVLIRHAVIPREEAALIALFGEEYRSYMSRTGRLVPRRTSGNRE